MSGYNGSYDQQMDTKNRIRIPSKLKGDDTKFVFVKGADRCIGVYTPEGFDEFMKRAHASYERMNGDIRRAMRLLSKACVTIETDAQGRIILPQFLKDFAEIEQDVVVCGADDHIEIWSKKGHDKYYNNEDEAILGIYDMLGI